LSVNQAVGVLISRGHTPDLALVALRGLASARDVELPAAARLVLDGTAFPARPARPE